MQLRIRAWLAWELQVTAADLERKPAKYGWHFSGLSFWRWVGLGFGVASLRSQTPTPQAWLGQAVRKNLNIQAHAAMLVWEFRGLGSGRG